MSMCPECQQGKHQNCDGRMWNFQTDKMMACGCLHDYHFQSDERTSDQ